MSPPSKNSCQPCPPQIEHTSKPPESTIQTFDILNISQFFIEHIYIAYSTTFDWTVLDAVSKEVLGTFSDEVIRVKGTNTPDLRKSGKLVQNSVDQRAIRARQL